MVNFIIVGAGGFFGAVSRYAFGLAAMRLFPAGFPYATLMVNVSGSFCLGLIAALTMNEIVPGKIVLLAGVGFLGAFTTFSTFSVDVIYLYMAGRYALCAMNVLLNSLLSIAAALAGFKLAG